MPKEKTVDLADFTSVLDEAKSGKEWAWSRLYGELAGPVLGYLRARGAAEPEDLLGEVFLHVVRRLHTFTGDWSGFRAWVFTIAHRRLIDERRRRERNPVEAAEHLEQETEAVDPETLAVNRVINEGIVAVLQTLSPDQRDVLLLRVVGGLTVDEVAEIVDKSSGAVKALQRRGLRTLQKNLGRPVPL